MSKTTQGMLGVIGDAIKEGHILQFNKQDDNVLQTIITLYRNKIVLPWITSSYQNPFYEEDYPSFYYTRVLASQPEYDSLIEVSLRREGYSDYYLRYWDPVTRKMEILGESKDHEELMIQGDKFLRGRKYIIL